MTQDRIDQIKLRLSKATKGDWVYDKSRTDHDSCIHTADAVPDDGEIYLRNGGVVGSSEWIWIKDDDGEFIANAKSDIEYLLSEIERLEEEK